MSDIFSRTQLLFGEEAINGYPGTEGHIDRWFKKVGEVWDKGLLNSLEEFQTKAADELAKNGPLHGGFNIILKGLFGVDWKLDPIDEFYKTITKCLKGFSDWFGTLMNSFKESWANGERNQLQKS